MPPGGGREETVAGSSVPLAAGLTTAGPVVEPATLFPITAADTALTTDEWYTPRWLFKAAGLVFDVDVCAPVAAEFRTCPARRFLTVVEDGLTAPWEGLIWCNPPYSETAPWVERLAGHGDWLALVPIFRETAWRRQLLRTADAMTLIDVDFGRPDGTIAGHPHVLMIVSRGVACTNALARLSCSAPYTRGAWFERGRHGGRLA